MATIYVDSAATGTNAGTSWANAYTSLGSTTAAAAGDTILVDDGHSESIASATTWTWSNGTATNPVKIISVDKATEARSAGATISVTSNVALSLFGGTYAYGLSVVIADQVTVAGNTSTRQVWENCTFSLGTVGSNRRLAINSSATAGVHAIFRDCTINLDTNGLSGSTVFTQCYGLIEFINCSVRVNSASSQIFNPNGRNVTISLDGCDLSSSGETTLLNLGLANTVVTFSRCRLPASYTAYTGTPTVGSRLTLEGCAAGSIGGATLGLTYVAAETGTIQSTVDAFRVGGADDGEQASEHSWQMAANASAMEVFGPLASPPIVRWVEGGAEVTLGVCVASGGTLNDDDLWIELAGPDDGSPAYAGGYHVSTRMMPQGTPSPLPTDGASTWSGSGVGTKQKVSVTYTPQVAGPVVVRVFLAKPSTTVYVDPKIEVS